MTFFPRDKLSDQSKAFRKHLNFYSFPMKNKILQSNSRGSFKKSESSLFLTSQLLFTAIKKASKSFLAWLSPLEREMAREIKMKET